MEKYNLSYYNLLIFTIITAIVSTFLIIVVYLQDSSKYMPFIITLISGIVFIIVYCIVKIYFNDKEIAKQILTFAKCPEYFNKKTIDGKEICTNDSVYYDENNKQYILKVYPVSSRPTTETYPFPSKLETTFRSTDNKYEKFPLSEINQTPSFTTNSKKCAPIYGSISDPNLKSFNQYALTPWTNFKSQCESII